MSYCLFLVFLVLIILLLLYRFYLLLCFFFVILFLRGFPFSCTLFVFYRMVVHFYYYYYYNILSIVESAWIQRNRKKIMPPDVQFSLEFLKPLANCVCLFARLNIFSNAEPTCHNIFPRTRHVYGTWQRNT